MCSEPGPVYSKLHPLEFQEGPVSQEPEKLTTVSFCLGEMGKPLLDLCAMHGSPCVGGSPWGGASFLYEWQFRKGEVVPMGSWKESLHLSGSRTLKGSLEISAPSWV